MSYVCRHGLGKAVLEETVADIANSEGYYTLLLDETVNAQVKKQCEFLVCYWSPAEEEVCTKYITSGLFAHTSADHLHEPVFDILKSSRLIVSLTSQQMVQISVLACMEGLIVSCRKYFNLGY